MTNIISKLIFMLSLLMGIFLVMSSSSWLGMWMGLELNLLSFIPLIINNNLLSAESAIKYFLIQAFASLIFLFSSILYIMKFSFYNFFYLNYENIMINFTMMLKLGAAPFHFWFPNIIEGLTWMNTLILLTLQKLGPLIIISYSYFFKMIIIFIITSSIVGMIGGFNQTSLRKLLVFSSINHMSWLLISNQLSNFLWLNYFLIYLIINISIILIFMNFNFFHMNQIFFMNHKNNSKNLLMKSMMFYNFLSLGGIPPFLGFLPKWLVIENMMNNKMFVLIFFMLMTTLVTLFFYMRLTFSAFTLSYSSMSWTMNVMHKLNNLNILMIFNFMNMFGLMIFLIMLMN